MAVASWRPALWVQSAFNADPNDPSVIPAWSDLSSPFFIAADNLQRGRQYELDQNQASQPSFTFLDQSEYLNPANTGSPYYPNVKPLRQILFQAMWPNQSTGNLMNANQGASSILGTTSAGYDSSFESYSLGSAVPWIDAVGGTSPVIGNTTPHTGSQDLTYTVSTAATEQGVTWPVPAVPGQQYTASAYVRQSSASTQSLCIGGLTMALDAYNRTTSNGWGTADVGGAWTNGGGSNSDFSVLPGLANILGASVNVVRTVTVGSANADSDSTVYVQVDQVATGAAIRAAVVGRRTGATTFYTACADFNTDSSVTFALRKLVAGVETTLTSTTMSFPYAIDTEYGLRIKVQGTNVSGSMWQQTGSEPSAFTLTTTDSAITGTGTVGCYQKLVTSNTNVSPNTTFSTFGAYGTVAGTSTSTTGAYVRLTATFTATQPTHTIGVLTLTGATAGTVLVDDVQYEQGASAGTFTTTGPTIWGVFRGSVERWPSEWLNGGFLGLCQATGVDAFEALNLLTLFSEYEQKVLTLAPDYYWTLGDSSGSTIFGDSSGNDRPPLQQITAKSGAGGGLDPGTSLNIVGDPSGTGVHFNNLTGGATVMAVGNAVNVIKSAGTFLFPPAIGSSWGATVAAWVTIQSDSIGWIASALGPSNANINGQTFVSPISLGYISGQFTCEIDNYTGTSHAANANYTVADHGSPHLVVGTVSQVSGGNTIVKLYYDGTLQATTTVTTASLGGMIYTQATYLIVGGDTDRTGAIGAPLNDTDVAHVAIWGRTLAASEVTALWDAGGLGNAGETSGTRVARYVASAWNGLTNIDSGSSIMGISTVTTGTPVLQACQDATTTEQGNFWADKDGQIVFAGRQDRYLNLTSRYTFGENESGGEYPYEEGIEYDFDPTFVYGQVTVDNADGVTATVSNLPSQRSYYPRSNTTAADLQSDDDAVQLGYWLLNTHDQPVQRIQSITLDPMGNPNLWTVILSLEIGDRVTVKRRPKAANGGAGLTMTGDFFVENISHNGIDLSVQNSTWKTTLLLSPTVETSGVFIFDNATYGTFDGALSRFAY